MNVLALDFGLKRIGVAIGSTEAKVAFPRSALENAGAVFDLLERLIGQENIQTILLGSPVKRDGSSGDIYPALQSFASRLERFRIPVILVDERYSTKIAQSKLAELNIKAREAKEYLDSLAAQIVLQEWLDQ